MGDTSPKKDQISGSGKYTPPVRRPGDDGAVVVQRAPTRTGGVPIQYPMLNDSNYGLWAVKMRVLLRPFGVWSALEGTIEFDQGKDDEAFAALSQSVLDAVMMAVANCETAHDAWEAIRRMRVGEDRVQKARVKQLKRQLDASRWTILSPLVCLRRNC